MVSSLPLISLKFSDYSLQNNLPKYLVILLAIIALIFLKWLALPVIIILYVILSLAFRNRKILL